MNKLVSLIFLSLSLTAHAQEAPALPLAPDNALIDKISNEVIKEKLLLVIDGGSKPYISDTGAHVFNFDKTINCDDDSCKGLLFAYSERPQNECLSNSPIGFGELPVALKNGTRGLFTVPSIIDPESFSRDYFLFYNKNICYELNYGKNGEAYENAVNLANTIIGS